MGGYPSTATGWHDSMKPEIGMWLAMAAGNNAFFHRSTFFPSCWGFFVVFFNVMVLLHKKLNCSSFGVVDCILYIICFKHKGCFNCKTFIVLSKFLKDKITKTTFP